MTDCGQFMPHDTFWNWVMLSVCPQINAQGALSFVVTEALILTGGKNNPHPTNENSKTFINSKPEPIKSSETAGCSRCFGFGGGRFPGRSFLYQQRHW